MTDATHVPGRVPLKLWADEPATITATFSGLTLNTLGGTWSGGIYASDSATATIVDFTVTQSGQVVTAVLSAADSTTAIGSADHRNLKWVIKNSVDPRTYLAGPLLLTRRPADIPSTDNGTGLTVTVTNSTQVSVTISNAVGTESDVVASPAFPYTSSDTSVKLKLDRAGNYFSDIYKLQASIRARKAYADFVRNGTPMNIAILGTSVEDHFNAGAGQTWVQRFEYRLRSHLGLFNGITGMRKCSILDTLPPNFSTAGGVPVNNTIGFGYDSTYIPYGASIVSSTLTDVSRYVLNYNRSNVSTASYIELVDSVDGVITGAGLDGYDATAGLYPGTCYTTWTSAALTPSPSRTLTIRMKTDAVKQAGGTPINIQYLHESQGAGDVFIWNGGHYGSTVGDHLDYVGGHYYRLDMLGTSGINADLVICGTFGLNETSSTTFNTNLQNLVTQVHAMQSANVGASFAFMTAWSKGSRTTAQNAAYVQAVYDAAAAAGAWVFPAHEIIGDGYNNYYGLLDTDKIHPLDLGHNAIANKMAEWVADFIGVPAVPRTIDGGSA